MKKMSPFTVKLSPIVDVRLEINSTDLLAGFMFSSYAPRRPIPLEGPSDVEISIRGELSGVTGDFPLEHPVSKIKERHRIMGNSLMRIISFS